MASRELKVGIFMLIGLGLSAAIVFVVGDERQSFDKHYKLSTTFEDVAGLKVGAPVRMGGMDVGSVDSVGFSADGTDGKLHVTFKVNRSAYGRMHDDSTAMIDAKGLLGDKLIVLLPGSDGHPKITEGADIRGVPSNDFQKYLSKVDEVLDLTKGILKNVEKVSGAALDKGVQDDLRSSLSSVRKLLADIADNDGFVHRLASNKKLADDIVAVIEEAGRAGKGFSGIASDVRLLLGQVRSGPGLAHTLLYSKDGDRVLGSLSRVSEELATTMKEVRTGKGALHELVYGESGTTVANDLSAMMADVRGIVRDVKAGKGTLGGLLSDPSIYEDVKSILGNLDRNQVLRALVRYSIKQDESPRTGTPSPAPASPAPASPAPVASGTSKP